MVCTNLKAQGIETHAVHFAAACRAEGIDCRIAAQQDGPIARLARAQAIPVLPLRLVAAIDFKGMRDLIGLLKSEAYDLVLASDAREFLPVVLAARWVGVDCHLFRHVNHRMKPAEVWAYSRWTRGFLPVSEFTRETLLSAGVPAEKARVLYNPVRCFSGQRRAELRATHRAQLQISPTSPVVGFAGDLRSYKGVFLLAEALNLAMGRVPDLQAVWMGPADQHAAVRAAISEPFQSRHHFLPWQDDPRPGYAAMDVLAVPSLCAEGFGRVAAEAQACGTPVLANRRAGGLAETLAEGLTGELLDARPGDWADAITRIARGQRYSSAPAIIEWADAKFGAKAMVQRLDAIVQADREARAPWQTAALPLA